jgi:hypothetical protein
VSEVVASQCGIALIGAMAGEEGEKIEKTEGSGNCKAAHNGTQGRTELFCNCKAHNKSPEENGKDHG